MHTQNQDLDDTVLLSRIAQGDRSAMRTIYERHSQMTQRFAMRYVSDFSDAGDIVQTTMMEVWRTAHRFGNRSSVRTWILSIARNKAIDLIRKVSKSELSEPDLEVADDAPSPEAVIVASQDAQRMRACIEELSDTQKAAVHLAFFEDLTYREIAQVQDVPESTIKTRIFHAKKLLMRCITRLH